MTSIGGIGGIGASSFPAAQAVDPQKAVGLGSGGKDAVVPTSILRENPATGPGGAPARASLSAFMWTGGSVDTEVLLVQVAVSMRDTEATSQKSKINTDQEAKKAQAKEKEKKLEEAQKKLEEAEAKKNEGGIFGKIKAAFDCIVAVLSVVAAIVMIASGAGAVAGVGLLGSAGVAIIMAIDSVVQEATGKGIAASIHLLIHPGDEEGAAKADMGFRISMAVIGMAFAVMSCGAGAINSAGAMAGAAANVGKSAASVGASVAKAGGTAAEVIKAGASVVKDAAVGAASAVGNAAATSATNLANSVKTAASAIQTVGSTAVNTARSGSSLGQAARTVAQSIKDAFQAVASIGTGAEASAATASKLSQGIQSSLSRLTGASGQSIHQGVKITGQTTKLAETTNQLSMIGVDVARSAAKFQETSLNADSKRVAADAKKDEAIMTMLDDVIDQALSRLIASGDRFASILDGITDAFNDRGDTLSRAQFRA